MPGVAGQLDEGARLRFGEGLLQAADGYDAADADVFSAVIIHGSSSGVAISACFLAEPTMESRRKKSLQTLLFGRFVSHLGHGCRWHKKGRVIL
jgi:hypothetical protein